MATKAGPRARAGFRAPLGEGEEGEEEEGRKEGEEEREEVGDPEQV